MKFQVKHHDGEQAVFEEKEIHSEMVKESMQRMFDTDDNVAIYEELKMADDRLCFTLKDRTHKIIVQYKQI